MATTSTPIFPQTIRNDKAVFTTDTANTFKTVAVANANGTKIEAVTISSTDTADKDISLYATISTTNYLLGTISIPLTAGFANNVPAVDVLRSTQLPGLASDANGNKFLYLASGTTLTAQNTTTLTSAKSITIFAYGEDF